MRVNKYIHNFLNKTAFLLHEKNEILSMQKHIEMINKWDNLNLLENISSDTLHKHCEELVLQLSQIYSKKYIDCHLYETVQAINRELLSGVKYDIFKQSSNTVFDLIYWILIYPCSLPNDQLRQETSYLVESLYGIISSNASEILNHDNYDFGAQQLSSSLCTLFFSLSRPYAYGTLPNYIQNHTMYWELYKFIQWIEVEESVECLQSSIASLTYLKDNLNLKNMIKELQGNYIENYLDCLPESSLKDDNYDNYDYYFCLNNLVKNNRYDILLIIFRHENSKLLKLSPKCYNSFTTNRETRQCYIRLLSQCSSDSILCNEFSFWQFLKRKESKIVKAIYRMNKCVLKNAIDENGDNILTVCHKLRGCSGGLIDFFEKKTPFF
jgi:hypothetical protein